MDEIIVEIPGIGEVAFPASMGMDQITQQVRRLSSQSTGMIYDEAPGISIAYPAEETPQDSSGVLGVLGNLGRQAGLTARGGIRGAMAIPAMVGDPIMQLVNAITGQQFPTTSQSLESGMSMAGLPQPREGMESTVYDVTSAMGGVGAPAAAARTASSAAQRFLQPLTERLGMQSLAAGSAAGAAGAARDAGVGEMGQMGVGLGAGMLVPGVAGVLGAGRGVLSAAATPLRSAGQERMAGKILADQAADPMAAIARAEAFQPSIPGSFPTTAAVTRDYGLTSLEGTVSQLPGAPGQFATRLSQNNLARNLLLEKYTANKVLDDAVAKRELITKPLREKALTNAPDVRPDRIFTEIENILKSDVGAREVVRDALLFYRRRVQEELNAAGSIAPGRLYSIRKDIADTLDGLIVGSKAENLKNVAPEQLKNLRNVIDGVIESGAPGYRNYMDTYATMSRPISQIKEMQKIDTAASAGITDPTTGRRMLTPVRFGKLLEQLEQDRFNPLTKTQMGVLKRVSKELDEGAMNTLRGVKPAGSDTFKNITVAHLLGAVSANPQGRSIAADMINRFARPISWVYGGSEDAVRQLVIDAMLDPQLAAKLMRKATQPNIQQASRSLLEIASQATYGPAFGIGVQQMGQQ